MENFFYFDVKFLFLQIHACLYKRFLIFFCFAVRWFLSNKEGNLKNENFHLTKDMTMMEV